MSQKPRMGNQPRMISPLKEITAPMSPVPGVVAAAPIDPPPAFDTPAFEPPAAETPVFTPPAMVAPAPMIDRPPMMTAPMDVAAAVVEHLPEPEAPMPIPTLVPDAVMAAPEPIPEMAEKVMSLVTTITPAKPTLQPKPTLQQGISTMMKSTEELVAFGQANAEAFMKSSQIWASGMQEMSKAFASTAKTSFEESVSTMKAMTTAKSVKEAMEMQAAFAKTAFEKAMAESNKLADASIKLTEQALAPITARVTVAVEKFGKAA